MKNLSLILNAVLFIAVAILFYLHFATKTSGEPVSHVSVPGDLKIAYITSDSVYKNYEYLKANTEKLEAKSKKLDADLNNRAQAFRADYESYQRNQGSLTIGQAKAVEEDLTKKQQNLQMYQQSLAQEMQNEQAKLAQAFYTRITDFLKKYGEEKGLQVVLRFDASSDVWYGDKGLDITKDVVDGLNAAYKIEVSAAPKKDTVTTKKK